MTDQHQPCQRAPGLPITIRESRRTRAEAEAPHYDGNKPALATVTHGKKWEQNPEHTALNYGYSPITLLCR